MNENEVQVWNYEGAEVRTVQIDGEPWFVLTDVCRELEISNSRMVADRLENDELMSVKLTSGGQRREMTIVNESGLYTVILRSDKPQAKPFRKWVTSVVLPSIRKTGSYSVQQPNAFENLSPQLQVLIQMETRQKQIEARQAEQATGEGYGGIRLVYEEIYRSIESRAGVSLNTRLTNKRNRMAGEGVCKSKRDKLTRVDIIAEDKKLIEIYVAIVKELAVKYGVCA